MGTTAEPLVLEALHGDYSDVERSNLIRVLADIGTEKSLEPLAEMEESAGTFSRGQAGFSILKIRARIKKAARQ